MKAIGVVRRMDRLGRVCIPKELCKTLGLGAGDPVEMFLDGHQIVMRKYDTAGDALQVLQNAQNSIRQMSMIPPEVTTALLGKLKEMEAILETASR